MAEILAIDVAGGVACIGLPCPFDLEGSSLHALCSPCAAVPWAEGKGKRKKREAVRYGPSENTERLKAVRVLLLRFLSFFLNIGLP